MLSRETLDTMPRPTTKNVSIKDILDSPELFIGLMEEKVETLWIYEAGRMVRKKVEYVPGLVRVFYALLLSVLNHKDSSTKLEVEIANGVISVYKDGKGIPVTLFTELNVDLHNDGAALANIFSSRFTIETANGTKLYKQTFTNNMQENSKLETIDCEGNWTKVTFTPQLNLFGEKRRSKPSLDVDDTIQLMEKCVVDVAVCLKNTLEVKLNNKVLPITSFEDYVTLYLDPNAQRLYSKVNENWEIYVSISDRGFQQVSFVNFIATTKGGTDVDFVTELITNLVVKEVNLLYEADGNIKVTPDKVKEHLWVFVKTKIDNPEMSFSKDKEGLKSKPNTFDVSDDDIRAIRNIFLEFWRHRELPEDLREIPNVIDAPKAGQESQKCTLILCEGKSAMSFIAEGLSVLDKDFWGVYALNGNLPSVLKPEIGNKKIQILIKMLGLQPNQEYANVESLRYGRLFIMGDPDRDGTHFTGLIIHVIYTYWPSLLRVEKFLHESILPIGKAEHPTKGMVQLYFKPEWGNEAKNWTISYNKGLASFSKEEALQFFANIESHTRYFIWEGEKDASSIELAFDRNGADERKTWLDGFEPETFRDVMKVKHTSYMEFVELDLKECSLVRLRRSIPWVNDGQKQVQRKLLFGSFKKKLTEEIPLDRFVNYASAQSCYRHGVKSMAQTCIRMAQDFRGSNNVNLFEPIGIFGSYSQGGKDCSKTRYLKTKLNPVTRLLFQEKDDRIVGNLNENGQFIEPKWYLPIIPLVLVNGCKGVGMGWSTAIPNYRPADIIKNVRKWLDGEVMQSMKPWYRGFNGEIVEDSNQKGRYIVRGKVEDVNERTFKITELPIGKWTKDYLERLKNNPLVEKFTDKSDTTKVNIEITMKSNKKKLGQKQLLKKFGLTTTISTSNMHLLDENGRVKKFDDPVEILKVCLEARDEGYCKRMGEELKDKQQRERELTEQAKFVKMVLDRELETGNCDTKDAYVKKLSSKGFLPQFPKKGANDEEKEHQMATWDDYKYLYKMRHSMLNLMGLEVLKSKLAKTKADILKLRNADQKALRKTMWLREISELEDELRKGNYL